METGKCDTIRIHVGCTGFGGKVDLGSVSFKPSLNTGTVDLSNSLRRYCLDMCGEGGGKCRNGTAAVSRSNWTAEFEIPGISLIRR